MQNKTLLLKTLQKLDNVKKSITPDMKCLANVNYKNYAQLVKHKNDEVMFLYGKIAIFNNVPKNIRQAYNYYFDKYMIKNVRTPYIWGKVSALADLLTSN